MSKPKPQKSKTVVMSFAVTSEMAEQIRKIPLHTKWIHDLVAKDLAICPTCRQAIKHEGEQ
jgi:hypothetical protein